MWEVIVARPGIVAKDGTEMASVEGLLGGSWVSSNKTDELALTQLHAKVN